MKNLSNHWYKVVGVICAFLFLLMVYRREARMRAHIESLESRIESMEHYLQGQSLSDSVRLVDAAAPLEDKPTATFHPKPSHPAAAKQPAKTFHPTPDPEPVEEKYDGKFRQVVKLELNTVDSATLVRVPGIGEGTARAILQYREKLGGYYSPEQLREKLTWESAQANLDAWCNDWFWVDEKLIRKLQINQLSFKELVHHPYLDYNEVKVIVKWRDRHEKVHNVADLQQIGIDDSVKLEKLLHYVEF